VLSSYFLHGLFRPVSKFATHPFDVLNRPNFGNIITPIVSGSKGARNGSAGPIVDTATTSRQIEFAMRFSF
jgi:hypothetical protein